MARDAIPEQGGRPGQMIVDELTGSMEMARQQLPGEPARTRGAVCFVSRGSWCHAIC